jgi:hypothetical protein
MAMAPRFHELLRQVIEVGPTYRAAMAAADVAMSERGDRITYG